MTWYDLSVFVHSNITISRLYEMLDKLEDLGFCIVYETFSYLPDGLYFEIEYEDSIKDVYEKIRSVGNGDLVVNWEGGGL